MIQTYFSNKSRKLFISGVSSEEIKRAKGER